MKRAAVFEETYADYLAQLEQLDITARQAVLGFEMDQGWAQILFFNQLMRVGPGGIEDANGQTADLGVCVVLCKYLLMAPDTVPDAGSMMTFKDFPDAAPLVHFFSNSVEGQIARLFSGRMAALKDACQTVGGQPYTAELAYQVKYRFSGLSRVPVILLFNDQEEGFAAQCTLLFQQNVQQYLDMESLAILGGQLVHRLQRAADLK